MNQQITTVARHAAGRRRTRFWSTTLVMGCVLGSALGIASVPEDAGAQQLGYTVIPTATRVSWDKDLPLTEGWLYGGRLSLLFGSQIELQPFFMRGTKFRVDSAAVAAVAASSLTRAFQIDHAGANIQVNLTDSDLSPFVRVGGGLLTFSPDSGDDVKRLTVLAGGGFRVNLGGIQGEIFAEQMRFRMSRSLAFGTDSDTTVASPATLRNWTYGAAVTIPLSTFEGERTVGLRGTRAPFEPYVGRLTFHEDLGLAEQDVMGIRTGLDFGPLVGVRGFYWRGINRDHDRTEPISGYGGEAQFTLNDGRGVTPYVVLGAGRIDFADDYRTIAGETQSDHTALIVGGGAQFSLTDRFRLNVAIRDFVITRDDVLSTANEPDDLTHSRMLSAGFTFALGGRNGSARSPEPTRETRNDARPVMRTERVVAEDSTATPTRVVQPTTRPATVVARNADSVRIVVPTPSGTMMTLPVPTVGEIIIRYGLPADTSNGRGTVRTTVDTVVRQGRVVDTVVQQVRTVDTVRVTRPETTTVIVREPVSRNAPPTVMSDRMSDEGTPSRGFFPRLLSARPSDVTPFIGIQTGGGSQAVLSARIDLGPLSAGSRLDLVPEVSVAVGSGRTTLMGLANARYTLPSIGGVRPYAMVGAGLSTDKLLVLGTSVGASMNMRSASRSPLYGFAELQGLNLFNQQRLMIGLSTRR